MNVTLTTDASFNVKHQIGTYAFYVSCKGGPFKMSGILRDQMKNPSQAEMKCICNAIAFLNTKVELLANIKYVYINTDSMNSIHLFSGHQDEIRKYKLKTKSYLKILDKYNELVKKLKNTGHCSKTIIFQHIKAHKHTNTPAHFVNQWCDDAAKEQMQIKLTQIKRKNQQKQLTT